MMKITKIVVTDESGNETTYEGNGFITAPLSVNYKKDPYQQAVTASLTLPARKDVKA